MLQQIACEACDRDYRLADDGIHYNDGGGGATWGICRKIVARDTETRTTLAQKVLETVEAAYGQEFIAINYERVSSALRELFQREGIEV